LKKFLYFMKKIQIIYNKRKVLSIIRISTKKNLFEPVFLIAIEKKSKIYEIFLTSLSIWGIVS